LPSGVSKQVVKGLKGIERRDRMVRQAHHERALSERSS
jgi:hypothetical protein